MVHKEALEMRKWENRRGKKDIRRRIKYQVMHTLEYKITLGKMSAVN